MFYDIIFFHNELDLLEIRINQHQKYIDKFIIITGDKTFSGNPKKNIEEEIYKRLHNFKNKLRVYEIKLDDKPTNSWSNEIKTLDYLNEIKSSFKDNDVILTSDVDEIINDSAFSRIKLHKEYPLVIQVASYYYYLNGRIISGYSNDLGPIVLKVKNLNNKLSEIRRNRINLPIITNGGWHFSYLGGTQKIIEKIKSFSHSEFDQEKYTSIDNLTKNIDAGNDIFFRKKEHEHFKGDMRSFRIIYEDINETYPEFLRNNQKKFNHLIKDEMKKNIISTYELQNFIKDNENYIFNLNKKIRNSNDKSEFLYKELKILQKELSEIKTNLISYLFKKIKDKLL